MLDIIMISLMAVLLLNLVVVFVAMGRRPETNNWLLAILLTGTTGAALAAVLAGLTGDESSRFVDLSLILVGLAAVPVVVRVVMLHRARIRDEDAS